MSSSLHFVWPGNICRGTTHMRMLFVDLSSTFNSYPLASVKQTGTFGAWTPTWKASCLIYWLADPTQSVRVGNISSSASSLSTSLLQGCVLSLSLFTSLMHDCHVSYTSNNHIVTFADDTTIVGFNGNGDKLVYWGETTPLVEGSTTQPFINLNQLKEIIQKCNEEAAPSPYPSSPLSTMKLSPIQKIAQQFCWIRAKITSIMDSSLSYPLGGNFIVSAPPS